MKLRRGTWLVIGLVGFATVGGLIALRFRPTTPPYEFPNPATMPTITTSTQPTY